MIEWLPSLRRMRHFMAGAVLAVLASQFVRGAEDPRPIRLAVTCQIDGQPAPEIQDQVTTALSTEAGVEVLERAQIDLLLQEGSLTALSGNAEHRVQLGRLLALDYFLNLRRAGGQWIIEAVNAQTGALTENGSSLPRFAEADAGRLLAEAAKKLVAEKLAGKPVAKAAGLGAMRVAVHDFAAEPRGDVAQNAAGFRLSAEVRSFLGTRGDVLVLDRALSEQVAREHAFRDAGLVASASQDPLLGADFLVTGKIVGPAPAASLELTVLAARGARVVGTRAFPLTGAALPMPVREWFAEVLHLGGSVARTYEESIQIEALEPFYLGVAKFHAGRYLEATDDFQRAYTLNEKFRDAMLWEARCYDAVGLAPLARLERRFVEFELVGRGFATTGAARTEDAVTFLGVTGPLGERLVDGRLEMLAIDLLAGFREKPRLQLASHLARFRDEYDVLVGTRNVSGFRWTDAPGFLSDRSLRGEVTAPDAQGRRTIVWQLVDNLSGQTRARVISELEADPTRWRESLRPALAALWRNETHPVVELPRATPLPEINDLEYLLDKKSGLDANTALLALALRDPENPRLPKRTLSKNGLEEFLNFGLRDYLLEKLPANNRSRPWLELARLISFLPFDQSGWRISGERVDTNAALDRFIAAHPEDLVGCVATYLQLYDQLASIDPAQLAERLSVLETKLARFGENDLGQYRLLREMTETLRITAQVATGRFPKLALPPGQPAHRLFVGFERNTGRPRVQQSAPGWRTDDWKISPESIRDPAQEARASLAILGRGDELKRVRPEWLTDFPNSGVLTTFAIEALHEANWALGRPILHEFDAAAERQHFRRIVLFCYRNLIEQIDHAESARAVAYWEHWTNDFVIHLCAWGYRDTVPDAEFEAMRGVLTERMNASNRRFGCAGFYRQEQLALDWRRIVRQRATDTTAVRDVWDAPREYFDREALLAAVRAAGEESWEKSPIANQRWTTAVHDARLSLTLTPLEFAELYLPYLPRVNERFPGPDFTYADTAFLLDFGSTLLSGGKLAEAENVLARIVAFVANKGAYYDSQPADATLRIPALWIAGQRDTETRLQNITTLFAENRRRGASWCLAIEPNAGHEIGRTKELGMSFLESVLRLRLLKSTDEATWTGDLSTHEILPADETASSQKLTAWLPDQRTAEAWRAFVQDRP